MERQTWAGDYRSNQARRTECDKDKGKRSRVARTERLAAVPAYPARTQTRNVTLHPLSCWRVRLDQPMPIFLTLQRVRFAPALRVHAHTPE